MCDKLHYERLEDRVDALLQTNMTEVAAAYAKVKQYPLDLAA